MHRSLIALAAVPLLLAGLAGCGDDSDPSDPSAASGGDRIEAAALTGLSEGDQVDVEEYIDIVLAGLEESTTARMRMETELGADMTMSGEGAVDYTASPPASEMTLDMPAGVVDGDLSVVSVDGLLYLSMGELTEGGWWELDPADPDSPMAGMGLDKVLEQSDPRASMESVAPAIEAVTFAGTEEVDGRELDRYELTIDPQQALAATGGQELPAEAEKMLPASFSYDLWLDEDNRFARMAMEYPVLGQTVAAEVEVYDWGADVSIEAPPAEEIVEMPEMPGLPTG